MPTPLVRRAIVVVAPILVIGYAVLGVVERRALHADGSWAFIQSLIAGGYWVGDPYRVVWDTIAETPLSVLLLLGVDDRGALAIGQGAGYLLIPSVAWACALWISRRSIVFDFLLLGYSVTVLAGGFLAIGEYNALFAFAALCFAAMVRFWAEQSRGMAWAVAGAALIVMSSHGLAVILAPFLLVALVLFRRKLGPPCTGSLPILLSMALLLAGSVFGVMAVLFPYASGNVVRASNLTGSLSDNHQLMFVIVWLLLLPAAVLVRARAVRWLATIVLIGSLVVLVVVQGWWATPFQQHAVRGWSGILLTLLLAEALVVVWPSVTGRPMSAPTASASAARLTTLSSAFFIALLIPAIVQTVQFGAFLRDFQGYVDSRTGFVNHEDLVRDVVGAERYGWPATFPSLSVAVRRSADGAIVLNPTDTIWTPPFDDHHPPELPARFLAP